MVGLSKVYDFGNQRLTYQDVYGFKIQMHDFVGTKMPHPVNNID
jgi:hypothetical protein